MDRSENKLVDLVLAGDQVAVRRLYDGLAPKLRCLFSHQVKTPEDIEELIQDTFLHLLDALPLYQRQSSLLTFAYSIGKHELMDYWRKQYAKRMIRTVPLLNHLVSKTYTSAETSLKMNQALERTYAKLKPIQAQILKLKYEEEKSVKEMATLLGLTPKAVEALLYRSRKAFKAVYVL